MRTREFTPENISELRPNQIFVFGSNMNGNHAGGAAKVAVDKFGAIEGQAVGLQGQSYAIPTLNGSFEKLSIAEIEHYVLEFFKFADENPHLDFYVTKIGCGIAGFSMEEIQSIFHKIDLTYIFNVALPQEFCVIKGYKGFNKAMKCREMQFKEGESYHQDGDIIACCNGIHFCENPLQIFSYYNAHNSVFADVVGVGKLNGHESDSKIVTSDIKIGAAIELSSLLKIGLNYTQKKVDFFQKRAEKYIRHNTINNSVNSGRNYSVNSGRDYSVNSGCDYSVNSGCNASVNSGRDYSVNSGRNYSVNSGCNASVNSGRDYSVNSGRDYSVCAGRFNSIIELNGINSFGIAGKDSRIKGRKGCAICLVEYDESNIIIGVKSAIVDGEILKEDVFYTLKDGEFIEVNG